MPREYNLEDLKPQVVTCEEFSVKDAFSKGSLANAKLLFEGKGASVQKDLYAPHSKSYDGSVFILASN